jgi:hypothetical protein
MTTDHHPSTTMIEPRIRAELRIPIDATEAPIAFEDTYPDATDLAVEMAGPAGLLATLVLPIDQARQWAGELFAAVSVAYREVTGDPHALSDDDLAALPPADQYHPGPGLIVHGNEHQPARARFHLEVEIQAEFLSTAGLRAALSKPSPSGSTPPKWPSHRENRPPEPSCSRPSSNSRQALSIPQT